MLPKLKDYIPVQAEDVAHRSFEVNMPAYRKFVSLWTFNVYTILYPAPGSGGEYNCTCLQNHNRELQCAAALSSNDLKSILRTRERSFADLEASDYNTDT